ncbi:MAG: APC family permease [Nitrososphaerales archaeon]
MPNTDGADDSNNKKSKNQADSASDLEEAPRMKRVVGIWNSFAIGYADVGADIYVAVGLIVALALQASPFAFLFAAVTYVTTGLAYAELASTYPIAGGAQYYSLKAFGNFHGFIAGWGLMLDYTIDVALFALVASNYFGSFFNLTFATSFLTKSFLPSLLAIVFILVLVLLNVVGIKYSANFNLAVVLINLVTMVVILAIGLPLMISNGLLQQWISSLTQFGTQPTVPNFVNAASLAMVSYIGIESISQAAEETKFPKKVIPTAVKFTIISVVLLSVLLSLLTVTLLPSSTYLARQNDEFVALAQHLPYLTAIFAFWVAFVGFAICYVSTNTGVIGVSRVTFSMARLKLLPSKLSRLSRRFLTPYITITLFPGIAIAVLLVITIIAQSAAEVLQAVAQLYNFGALIAYMYVNLSLIVLRVKDPTPRAWKLRGAFHISRNGRKYEIPFVPIIGFISCLAVWLIVVGFHSLGRDLGVLWFAIGIVFFIAYRKRIGLPVFRSPKEPRNAASAAADTGDKNDQP